ncbi:MAG: hypothetical protein PVH12_08180 [Candidatus Bathyarchaeota archaeon]|jgi:hypothetical protein
MKRIKINNFEVFFYLKTKGHVYALRRERYQEGYYQVESNRYKPTDFKFRCLVTPITEVEICEDKVDDTLLEDGKTLEKCAGDSGFNSVPEWLEMLRNSYYMFKEHLKPRTFYLHKATRL